MPQDMDYNFGRMAVKKGLLNQGQFEDCVEVLMALERADSEKRLWEVAARKGYMKQTEIESLLETMGHQGQSSAHTAKSVDSAAITVSGREAEEEADIPWDISLDAEVQPVTDLWSRQRSDPLAVPLPPEEKPVDLGPGKLQLRCIRGADTGQVFVLMKTTTVIGRDVNADVTLKSPAVSRLHAEVVMGKRQVVARDLKSRNGIYVKGVLVKESVLQVGETLRIGKCVLMLERVASEEKTGEGD